MALINVNDILDEFLKNSVLPEELEYADEAYYDLCNSLGAYRSQVITNPLPIDSKRYITLWVCVETCSRLIGTNRYTNAGGFESDVYKEKMEIYKAKLAEARSALTLNKVTGIDVEVDDTSSAAGEIERA